MKQHRDKHGRFSKDFPDDVFEIIEENDPFIRISPQEKKKFERYLAKVDWGLVIVIGVFVVVMIYAISVKLGIL